MTEDIYDRFMAAHAKGPFFLIQHAGRALRDGGRIIAISTVNTRLHPPGGALYTCPPTAASCPDRRLVLMSTMDQWTATVCADLGLDPSSADLRAVLDLTRDVAHGVARPAAPLTAYLVGVAVGRGLALPDAAGRIAALAAGWSEQSEEGA